MHHNRNGSTTYARILHYTKLSHGPSQTNIRERFFRGFTVMNIGGGNSTDDPTGHRELFAANQSGKRKYSNEHRREKHFEARDPPRLRAFIPRQSFPSPTTCDDANNYPPSFSHGMHFLCLIWPPRLPHRGPILERPIRYN
jgi:hypothetical protein